MPEQVDDIATNYPRVFQALEREVEMMRARMMVLSSTELV